MKKLPPTLLIALAIEVVWIFTFGMRALFTDPRDYSIALNLASSGMFVVIYVLGIAGFLELAGRTTGRTRIGLRVVAAGFALGLADMGFWIVFSYVQPHWSIEKIGLVQQWSWFVLNLLPVLGLVIATFDRDRRAAVIGLVVLLIADPLPPLAQPMYGWLGDSWKAMIGLENGLRLVEVILMFVLARLVADGEPVRARDIASSGLRTIASALWLRVIAAVGVSGLTLMLMLGSSGEGSMGVLKLAMLSGAVINAISVAMMVRGALAASRGGVVDLPRTPLVLAAGGALWCLGVALHQLPFTYRMLYGDHDDFSFSGSHDTQDYAQALALTMPLVATGAIAAVAAGIAGFAGRRGLEQLRDEAQGKGAGFVGLMLASIAIQAWLLPKADTRASFAMMTIGAAVLALWATVLMARLCALAADSLHAEPGLPTATLRA